LLEVQVVDLADSITYDAHDVDDAVELGWLDMDELRTLPIMATCEASVVSRYGEIQGTELRKAVVHELINLQVAHLIHEAEQQLDSVAEFSAQEVCQAGVRIGIPSLLAEEKTGLETYLYERLYRHADLMEARTVAQDKILKLAKIYLNDPNKLPALFRSRCETRGTRRAAAECIAAMTDHSFIETYQKLAG